MPPCQWELRRPELGTLGGILWILAASFGFSSVFCLLSSLLPPLFPLRSSLSSLLSSLSRGKPARVSGLSSERYVCYCCDVAVFWWLLCFDASTGEVSARRASTSAHVMQHYPQSSVRISVRSEYEGPRGWQVVRCSPQRFRIQHLLGGARM